MKYTQNYNLRKPEDTDPADIQDLNYNADAIDGKLKEIEDWEAAHLQASNPHSITPALIGAETPTGAQQKANQAETNAKSYADIVTNSALNSAKNYADGVLESANSHTDQVASDLSQKLNETRIKVLDVEQDVSNISKVLTNLNPDQEAKQSVSGYGILSLPKNAANGQISCTMAGQTATNLAINGKGDSTEGWWRQDQVTITEDGFYELDTSDVVRARPRAKTFAGRKYLLTFVGRCISGSKYSLRCCLAKGGSALADVRTSETAVILFPSSTDLKRRYAIFNPTDDGDAISIFRDGSTGEEPTKYHIKEIMLFDVTDMEGTDEEIYNEINTKFPYYFSGTKSTVSAIRLKSVGKNLFDGEISAYMQSGNIYFDGSQLYFKRISTGKYSGAITKIKTEIGKTYIVSWKYISGDISYLIRILDKDYNLITSRPTSPVSFTATTEETYILFTGTKAEHDGTILSDIQVEKGNQATEYEPYKESVAYITAKDESGNILELRSLPNGTKDEISLNDKKLTKNISDDISISDIAYASLDTITYTNVDVVVTTAFSNAKAGTIAVDGMTRYYNKDGVELTEVAQTDIDLEASVGKYYWGEDKKLYIIVAKGDYTDIAAARTGLGTTKLNYQLAEPVEIPIEVSGNIVSYPSGTIYIERAVPDAGIYTDKMTVIHQDLPIKVLEKLSKIDFMTGLETELDVSDAVIAENKLSFTHPDLVDGDIVFFTYEYDRESTEGETEIEYYDSRYVIKDSVTEKFYKWHIAVADGVPSIELTEV